MKLSLLTFILMLLGIAGAIGLLTGLIERHFSSILFGGALMMTATSGFVASTWRDEKDFSDP